MALDVIDAGGLDPGIAKRLGDRLGLTIDAGCQIAGLVGAVIVVGYFAYQKFFNTMSASAGVQSMREGEIDRAIGELAEALDRASGAARDAIVEDNETFTIALGDVTDTTAARDAA